MAPPENQNPPSGDANSPAGGIDPYKLPDLPRLQRKILQIVLHTGTVPYHVLVQELSKLPEYSEYDADALDAALEELSEARHIVCLVEEEETAYQANLRRKSGRNLVIKGIWDVLESASKEIDEARNPKTDSLATSLFGKLDGDGSSPTSSTDETQS